MPLLAVDLRPYAERLAELGARLDAKLAELQGQIPAPLAATAVRDTTDPTIVHLTWQPVDGSFGYVVGRDGTDNRGNLDWYTLDPKTATSRDMIWLNPVPYRFDIIAVPSGIRATLTA